MLQAVLQSLLQAVLHAGSELDGQCLCAHLSLIAKASTGPSADSHDALPVSGSGSFAHNTGQDFADVSFDGDSCPRSILVTHSIIIS